MNLRFWHFGLVLGVPAVWADCGTGTVANYVGLKQSKDPVAYERELFKKLGGGATVTIHAYDGTGYDGRQGQPAYNDKNKELELFATRKIVIENDINGNLALGVRLQTQEERSKYAAAKVKWEKTLEDKVSMEKKKRRQKFLKNKEKRRQKRLARKEKKRLRKQNRKNKTNKTNNKKAGNGNNNNNKNNKKKVENKNQKNNESKNKKTQRSNKNKNKLRRQLATADTQYEIKGADVLRFDFGGFEFSTIDVSIANILDSESGFYRTYKQGKFVDQASFVGSKGKEGILVHIQSKDSFDTIEFGVDANTPQSTFLVSYIEYCKAETCTEYSASWSGDPHLTSFDGLKWDCQGHGHFQMFRGKRPQKKDFQVQAIFDSGKSNRVTVTRAIAIDPGDGPIVQVSVPDTTTNGCDYTFYVDRKLTDLTGGTGSQNILLDVYNPKVSPSKKRRRKVQMGKNLVFTHAETGSQVSVNVKHSTSNGCVIAASICLGQVWRTQSNDVQFVGLLGGKKNNDMSDDWIDQLGNKIPFDMEIDRRGNAAYKFCTSNWCIPKKEDVLFEYPNPAAGFDSYNKCDGLYEGDISDDAADVVETDPKLQAAKQECIDFADNDDDLDICFTEVKAELDGGGDPLDGADNLILAREAVAKATEKPGVDEDADPADKPTYQAAGAKERPWPLWVCDKEALWKGGICEVCKNDGVCTKCDRMGKCDTAVAPLPVAGGGANGDPHIKLWDGELYDFHGVCDLVLLHNPGFENGIGMDIHMRTKKTRRWSYISTAVIRIGMDTFEVMGEKTKNQYYINGVANKASGGERILPMSISGYPIQFKQVNSQQAEYVVDLGKGEKITFKTWNNMVRVDVAGSTANNFASSIGLMGTYASSLMMARDNTTIIEDLNDFGQEWQVLPEEPKLFHNIDGPQAPSKCEIPSQVDVRRNLAASEVQLEEAEVACAGVNEEEMNLCIFDVIAMSDNAVAGAY